MKKFNLKFLSLSLLILAFQNSFAEEPAIKRGEVADSSIVAGTNNLATKPFSLAFGDLNKAIGDSASIAFGLKNEASATTTAAFGNGNKATAFKSVAFGYDNNASAQSSQAFGQENKAFGAKSSAFGYKNNAEGGSSVALGNENKATATEGVAVGHQNMVEKNYGIALGNENEVKGEKGVAVGYQNEAIGISSSAFGIENRVSGVSSTVIGHSYEVSGKHSGAFGLGETSGAGIALTYNYKNAGENSYSIGNKNNIAAGTNNNFILGNEVAIGTGINNVVVLGKGSKVTESDTVSVGSETGKRRIVYVAAGTADTDAVNKKQMDDAIGGVNNRMNSFANATDPTIDTAAWKAKLGVGSGGGAVVDAYTKAETDTKLATKANIADVYTKTDSNNKFLDKSAYNIDKATFATKTELNSRANKDGSNLSASDIAIWKTKLATGSVNAIANTATGTGSTGLGHGNVVAGNNSTAVGYKNNVSGNNSGAFGDPNTITGNRSYAVGNDNNIAGDDNFVVGSNVTIGTGIKNSVALGNNSTVSNSNEVSVGSAGNERKITNVADGVVSASSTDAVNGRQLFKVANSISAGNTDALRKEFRRENEKVKNEVRQVGSLSAALSALHPLQYDKNKPNQIMAGFGQYRDKSAVAVGMAHYFTENLMMTGGVSLSEGSNTKAMANVGLTWKFGKGGSESTNAPNYVVQNEVSRLAKENAELKAKINAQDERMKALESKLEKLLKNK